MTPPTAPIPARFKMRRTLLGLVAVLALVGCQLGGAGRDAPGIALPSAIQGPAVEVTSLAPMGAAPPVTAQPAATATPPPPVFAPAVVAPVPAPVSAPPKTPGHIACDKRGGRFVAVGLNRAMTCQTPTRDAGKQCRKAGDCEGVCLGRTGTCAPVVPLLGCQDVLQNDGRRVTLCID